MEYKARFVDLDSSTDREVEHQIAAVKAISDIEVDHMLTCLRLIRSYFSHDQLRVPVLQFFQKNLPNAKIVRNSGDEHFDLSMAYPSSATMSQSFDGLQFSVKTVKSRVGVVNLQIENYLSQKSLDTVMLRMTEGLQTPGAINQKLSVGVTPETVRLPKHGEMLLSVHGSPLGVNLYSPEE